MASLIKNLDGLVTKYPGVDWLLTDNGVFPCHQVTNAVGEPETQVLDRSYVVYDENTFATLLKDTEIPVPSHLLDHNYANPPRDPVTDSSQPSRKRVRRKMNQTHDEWSDEVRSQPQPDTSLSLYTAILKSHWSVFHGKTQAAPITKRLQPAIAEPPETVNDAPQPVPLVTKDIESPVVENSVEGSMAKSPKRRSRPRDSFTAVAMTPPSSTSTTQDSLGDDKTAAEFFLDNMFTFGSDEFMDMDFSDIPLNTGTISDVFPSIDISTTEFRNIELTFNPGAKSEFLKTDVDDLDALISDPFDLSTYSSYEQSIMNKPILEIDLTDDHDDESVHGSTTSKELLSTTAITDNDEIHKNEDCRHSFIPDVLETEHSSLDIDPISKSGSSRRSNRRSKIPKRHEPYFLSLGRGK